MELFGQASPAGGVSLLSGAFPNSFNLYPGSASATKRTKTISGQSFSKAVELTTQKETSNFWGAEYNASLSRAVKKNGVALLRFHLRCTSTQNADGMGVIQAYCQKASPNWDKSVTQQIIANKQWREYLIPFTFSSDYQPGQAMLAFGLGASKPQTLQLAAVELIYYGSKLSVNDLPKTDETYQGRDPDATWRKQAQARIEQIRKGDFVIEVTDANGLPVSGARVSVSQRSHAFQFGTALAMWRLVSNAAEDKIYQKKFRELFNAGGPENALKWEPWIGDWGTGYFGRSIALRGLRWMKNNDMPARGHVLVWPSWGHLPGSVSRHKNKPDPVRGLILDHIKDVGRATRNYVYEWDVLNEPYANHDMMDVFGRKIMVDWFKAARQQHSTARLYLNDYGILSGAGLNTAHQNHYESTARYLLSNKAPLGGLGFQGHFTSPLTPPEKVLKLLDRYAKLKLPMKITEFDVDVADESMQADYTRDFLYATFSHPSVSGVQLWGFWEKQHWRPNAALYTANWKEKPNGKAFRELTQNTWHTSENGFSNTTGSFAGRGFYGEYDLSVTADGAQAKSQFNLGADGQKLIVRLETLDTRPRLTAKFLSGNRVRLSWGGATTYRLQVQKSFDLKSWQNTGLPLGQGQTIAVLTLPTTKPTVFYRLHRLTP
jgi:GH35 family endo-1,4-beta-xylanase